MSSCTNAENICLPLFKNLSEPIIGISICKKKITKFSDEVDDALYDGSTRQKKRNINHNNFYLLMLGQFIHFCIFVVVNFIIYFRYNIIFCIYSDKYSFCCCFNLLLQITLIIIIIMDILTIWTNHTMNHMFSQLLLQKVLQDARYYKFFK